VRRTVNKLGTPTFFLPRRGGGDFGRWAYGFASNTNGVKECG
jgi:hypothetical protein